MAVPNIVALNNTNQMECVTVNITDDNIVEGTERFYVQLNGSENNQIMIVGNDAVPVYIVDNEGKLLFTIASFVMHICSFSGIMYVVNGAYLVPIEPLVKHHACYCHCNYIVPYEMYEPFMLHIFVSFTVIHLQFEQQNYTFSEDTETSDAIITVMISNYDELDINHDVSVTLVRFASASNATHYGMVNIHNFFKSGCFV